MAIAAPADRSLLRAERCGVRARDCIPCSKAALVGDQIAFALGDLGPSLKHMRRDPWPLDDAFSEQSCSGL